MKITYFNSQFKKFCVYFSNRLFRHLNYQLVINFNCVFIIIRKNLIFINQIGLIEVKDCFHNPEFDFVFKFNEKYLF